MRTMGIRLSRTGLNEAPLASIEEGGSPVFSRTESLGRDVLDLYCRLESIYARKFLYLSRDGNVKLAGLGAVTEWDDHGLLPYSASGGVFRAPLLFSAGPFDPTDSRPLNPLFERIGDRTHVLPEVVLIEEDGATFIQVNGTSEIPDDAIERILARCSSDQPERRDIPFALEHYTREKWVEDVGEALARIRSGEFLKIVLARESRVQPTGDAAFSSRDMVFNLIDSDAHGTIFLCETDGAWFMGATPELLVSKRGQTVTTMCLAGTITAGGNDEERARAAAMLLADDKNLREHAFVVEHLSEAMREVTDDIQMPARPVVLSLRHVQHLFTPITGRLKDGVSLIELRDRLHPTPALAGYPVEPATAAIRDMEEFNRGLYGGTFGYVDLDGDGEFSVAIRSGVFCDDFGYVYAGCGIVEGSDPDVEYDELDDKLKTILSAFQAPADEARRSACNPSRASDAGAIEADSDTFHG